MNTHAIETRILSPAYINSLHVYFGLNIALPLKHEILRFFFLLIIPNVIFLHFVMNMFNVLMKIFLSLKALLT